MSEVSLRVGGRSYNIACAEGEEMRLNILAARVDDVVGELGAAHSHDARGMLLAALILADRLDEAQTRAGNADRAAETLEQVATNLENLAQTLEAGAPNT